MLFADFHIDLDSPLLALAVHNGHDLRSETSDRMALDEADRLREEDPHTGELARRMGSYVIANRSRFEVDLNRPRNEAVYEMPEDAWGLDLWKSPLSEAMVEKSLGLYDEFYERLGDVANALVVRHGGFVLYDVHSYNHRRQGPDGPTAPQSENPEINLGTGTLPPRWKPVAETFLGASLLAGFDARENVKFEGRRVAEWTHENFGDKACALAIEFKKTFMNEWTDDVDAGAFERIAGALDSSTEPVLEAWRSCL